MDKTTTETRNCNMNGSREVVGVRFKEGGKIYFFSPNGITLNAGDGVIVETARGPEFAYVVNINMFVEYSQFPTPLKSIIRKATPADAEHIEQNRLREAEALEICAKKVSEHNLDMKLMSCEINFDGSRITFCFVSDNRVDFRALVRDLATIFRTRIELRQIGVRDKAKMLGGIGACGRSICCSSFLRSFVPVSIKMAKDQNIALSPSKISGICGRLMCCLKYEQDVYEETRKRMPYVNNEVMTPEGPGTVVEVNLLTERTKVKILSDDGAFTVRDYPLSDITISNARCYGCHESNAECSNERNCGNGNACKREPGSAEKNKK